MNDLIIPVTNPVLDGLVMHYVLGAFLFLNVFVVNRVHLPMFRVKAEDRPLFYGLFSRNVDNEMAAMNAHQHKVSASHFTSAFLGAGYLIVYPWIVSLDPISPMQDAANYAIFIVAMLVSDFLNHKAHLDYAGGNVKCTPKPTDNPDYNRFRLVWPILYYVGSVTFYILTAVYIVSIVSLNWTASFPTFPFSWLEMTAAVIAVSIAVLLVIIFKRVYRWHLARSSAGGATP